MSSRKAPSTTLVTPVTGSRRIVPFVALRHPDFRAFWATTMLWMMGDQIEHVITYWAIFQLFHSPLLGGFAVISHWLPYLLLSVYFGAVADRFDCRRILQVSHGMFMGVSLVWGLLLLTGSLQVWHVAILLTVHGLAGALGGPAGQLMIHDIVGPEQLPSAVRLNATGIQLGTLLGPAVGGAFMLALGPALGLLTNALVYVPRSLWLLTVPYTGHLRDQPRPLEGRWFGVSDAARTVREVAANRVLVAMIALAGASSLLIGNAFLVFMPDYTQRLGADESGVTYSVLLAAHAIGAVVGGVLLDATGILRPRARTAIICTALWAVSIGSFPLAPNVPLAFLLLFLAGVLSLTFSSMAQTLVQLLAPVHLRGRAIGLFHTSFAGLRAISGVTVGVVGEFIGVDWSLMLSAAVLTALMVGLLAFAATGETSRETSEGGAGHR